MNEYIANTARTEALREYVREWYILLIMSDDSCWFECAFLRVQTLESDYSFSRAELKTVRQQARQMLGK